MPKLPHSEPLATELSGAVDRGAHAVDRRIGKTLSAYFLTEQAAFFILIALVKNVTAHLRHSQYMLLIGTGAQVGVHPASEYMFVVFVTPVGPYFKGGFATNPYVIIRQYDRAAPLGTGTFKVGGNYAASLRANKMAHDAGYASEFYLDAKEKKYIDECGAANFFGIKNNTYVTPLSTSILPSITNRSLMQLAEDMGMKVERRPIPEEELTTFEEAGACGTAAVISPIGRIDDLENQKSYVIAKDGKPGPISEKLYNKLRGIQYGDEADPYGWVTVLD